MLKSVLNMVVKRFNKSYPREMGMEFMLVGGGFKIWVRR